MKSKVRRVFAIALLVLAWTCHPSFSLDPQIPLRNYRYDTWMSENGLPSATVQTILQTRDGYLWFGTPAGLAKFDGIRFTIFDKKALPATNADVLSLLEDRNGTMWIGTRGAGIIRYQNGKFKNFTTRNGLSNNFIWYSLELNNGDLWFSTEKGIDVYREGKFQRLAIPKLENPFFWTLFQDSHEDVWLGSHQHGLLQIKGNKQVLYNTTNGLRDNTVYTLNEDREGNLWIGTRAGLTRYRNGSFTHFTAENGLSHDVIYALLVDRDDVLWIGTAGGGIDRYINGKFETFRTTEGLSGDTIWSLYEDREGSIWIGPISYGLNRFADDRKTSKGIAPPVFIDRILVDGKETASGSTVGIHQGNLEVDYGALSFIAPEKVTFRYRLDGHDKDWVEAGIRRNASYKNLPPGSYRFQVIAANHNGVWNQIGAALDVRLVVPITRRIWFYALCLFVGLTLVFAVYYLRVAKLRNQEKLLRDLVENRTAELQKEINDRKNAEQQLLQIQKMEAVGRLAGGVAHDFNNILMAVTSYSELLLMRMPDRDPLCVYASEIRRAAEQGADLTRQLLAFSRRQILSPKLINLNDSITTMQNMLRRLIGEDIELEIITAEHLGTIKADPGQIQQILMNLVVNSRDAMPSGGMLRVETSNIEVDREFIKRYPGLLPGRFVLLQVQDSGHGMDEDTLKQIFEPFFTTKAEGKGTGLGLATVFGIVKQSGGYIYVKSKLDMGTTFSIYLPRVDIAPELEWAPLTSEHENGQGETVLLVDDNEMVRSSAGSFLEMNGYRVLYAENGSSAIALLKENSDVINLMISDVVMPGMSGVELAEQVKNFRPELKMLFMSGYTSAQSQLQAILDSGCEFISKPVAMDVLLNKIRELLSFQKVY